MGKQGRRSGRERNWDSWLWVMDFVLCFEKEDDSNETQGLLFIMLQVVPIPYNFHSKSMN